LANTPQGTEYILPQAARTLLSIKLVKDSLKALEKPFEERIDSIANARVGLFRHYEVERKARFIPGSTDKMGVLTAIFDSYTSWYNEGWLFIFFVAKIEQSSYQTKQVQTVSESCKGSDFLSGV